MTLCITEYAVHAFARLIPNLLVISHLLLGIVTSTFPTIFELAAQPRLSLPIF